MKKAFTLIELLVVIAIIAILAAILFPVFTQAKMAAKQTQALSNIKNVGTGTQLYMANFDDLWPVWSAGMGCDATLCPPRPGTSDTGSVFDVRYMYPWLIDPYIKNGTNVQTGELKDVWANPVSKQLLSSFSNTWAYNHWTLGGFSSCARTINMAAMPSSCTRTAAAYAEFADGNYNYPAPSTSVAYPGETIAFSDGAQLSRPPQFAIAFPTSDALNIAVWGPFEMKSPTLFGPAGASTRTGNIARLQAGGRGVVVYADNHAKAVPISTLYHRLYYTDSWRGGLNNNKYWSRDWGTN